MLVPSLAQPAQLLPLPSSSTFHLTSAAASCGSPAAQPLGRGTGLSAMRMYCRWPLTATTTQRRSLQVACTCEWQVLATR